MKYIIFIIKTCFQVKAQSYNVLPSLPLLSSLLSYTTQKSQQKMAANRGGDPGESRCVCEQLWVCREVVLASRQVNEFACWSVSLSLSVSEPSSCHFLLQHPISSCTLHLQAKCPSMVELQNSIHSILSAPLAAESLLQTWDNLCSWNIYMWNHSLGREVKYCPLGSIPLPGRDNLLSFFFLTAAFSSCLVLLLFHNSPLNCYSVISFGFVKAAGGLTGMEHHCDSCLKMPPTAFYVLLVRDVYGIISITSNVAKKKKDYLYHHTLSWSPLAHLNVLPPSLSCDNSWLLSHGRLIHRVLSLYYHSSSY